MRKIVSFVAVMLCAVSLFAGWQEELQAAKAQGISFSDDNKTLIRCPTNVTSVVIPSCVTTIAERAFYKCRNLSITIPASVTTIGEGAFVGVRSIRLAPRNNLTFFMENGALINLQEWEPCEGGFIIIKATLLYVPCDTTGEYVISESVTHIGMGAFGECRNLTSITIPDSVTTINDGAFYKCSSLTNITIPDSVTTIGRNAFYGCNSLTRVEIPRNCNVHDRAFRNCQVIRR